MSSLIFLANNSDMLACYLMQTALDQAYYKQQIALEIAHVMPSKHVVSTIL